MALRYRASLRTTRTQLVVDDIDSGSGPGILEICTAAYAVVLAAFELADPCGAVSSDVLTFDVPVSDTAADATGTAAVARIKNSDGDTIVDQLIVGHTGGSEHVILNQATNGIVEGQTVTITSGTITHNSGS